MKKSVMAILTTAVMIVSFLGPIMFAQKAYGLSADPTNWYMTETGVLGTDSYVLYPYKAQSTNIGLSKFGELIDNNTNVGIEYGARDPWAEPPGPTVDNSFLPKNVWINGWMLSLTYNNSLNGLTTVWAAAMFGDLASYGGPWLYIKAPYSCTYEWQESFRYPGYEISPAGVVTGTTLSNGGRKTNGTVITDPIQVLYDGPRKFIAVLTNHIWDINENTGTPSLALVNFILTIEFDKVSKQVIVFKDVKAISHPKYEISPLVVYAGNTLNNASIASGFLCQLSDREEWDLGAASYPGTDPYSSYVHFYTTANDEGFRTDYNDMYTVCPTLPPGISVDVIGNVTFDTPVNRYGSAPSSSGTYDYAQMISNDLKYVGYAAYWPALSDWSADAGGGREDLWYRPLNALDSHSTDAFNLVEPFLAPLTVGEWDFVLTPEHNTYGSITSDKEFRAIAVYGVTDLNNGDDANIKPIISHSNVPDSEAMYQLTSVFRPWDLVDMMYKDTARWVDKYAADGDEYVFYLKYSDQYPDRPYQSIDWPYVYYEDFVYAEEWNGYDTFAERVLINNTLQVRGTDYFLDYDEGGRVYVEFYDAPSEGSEVKMLFSTSYYEDSWNNGTWEWLVVGRDSQAIDSAGSAMVSTYVTWYSGATLRNSGLDMQDTTYGPNAPSVLSAQRSALLPARTGYRDANVAPNLGRLALKDDWSCHVNVNTEDEMQGIPISSSNIITVGGPAANAVTEYTNDFTDAFATLPGWTGSGAPTSVIFSTSCWSKNTYVPKYDQSGKQTVGYGMISTFQDLNGTTFLVVYGYTGQDTYYTCWALQHSDVLDLASWENMPEGVTTLVLQFNYTMHPTDYCFVTIMEALGTISEYNYQGYFTDMLEGPIITPLQITNPPFPGWPDYPIWVTDKYPAIHVDP